MNWKEKVAATMIFIVLLAGGGYAKNLEKKQREEKLLEIAKEAAKEVKFLSPEDFKPEIWWQVCSDGKPYLILRYNGIIEIWPRRIQLKFNWEE